VARVLADPASARRIPGFGHPVYRTRDPRADCLLELLDPLLNQRTRGVIDDVRAVTATTTPAMVNVDFALGALAYATRMPVGLTEAVFVIARTAGWIAHGLEEYAETPLRFRVRAIYTGPPPGAHALSDERPPGGPAAPADPS
jgi:citrate synthase